MKYIIGVKDMEGSSKYIIADSMTEAKDKYMMSYNTWSFSMFTNNDLIVTELGNE